jgi:hypothetical protein
LKLDSPVFKEPEKADDESLEAKERKMIQTYWQRFRKAQNVMGEKHRVWKTLDTFDRGKQWEGQPIPPWVPKPVTNYIRYIRTLKRANLASAIPKSSFSPVYEADKQDIMNIQKAYNHVWEEEKIDRIIRRCIDRSLLQGTSWAFVYWDEDFVGGKYYKEGDVGNQMYEGQIKVKRFPNTNIFFDPDAYTIDMCKYVETTELVALSTIKNNPAFKKYAGKKLAKLTGKMLEMEDSANGSIFSRDYKPSDGTDSLIGDDMATLHTHWERFLNEEGQWQLDVTYYLRSTDFALLRVEDVQPNDYPFAPYYDEEEEQDIWGTSIAMDILENQKIINKTSQTASIIGVLNQNPQKVVLRESGINAQELARTGTLAGKVWQSNIPNPIEIIQPPDVPKGIFELEDRMKNDIREMAGVNEAYTGDSVGSLTTSTGVDSLIERSTLRDKDKSTQIDEFVERLSDLIVKFVIVHWRDERPMSVRKPNGQTEYETWKPLDDITMKNLCWKVKSDVYAKAPMTQASRRQQADKLMQMQGQFQFNPPIITPEEWVRFQDFDMKEEILYRMEQDRDKLQQQEQQNMTQQVMQIIQNMKDAEAQGLSPQEVQQSISQQVTQLLAHTQSTGASQTSLDAAQGSAASDSQPPQGTTSQVAMSNMANGS